MAVNQTLSVTEVPGSGNISTNTSKVRIFWQSTQTGDSWNGYTRIAKCYVSINGGAEIEYAASYTLPKVSTVTIVENTITVPHREDGSCTVSVRTWMDTGISAGVVEKFQTITLTTIPRASTISYVSNVTLGNVCTVQWTPLSKDFYYKLEFWLGGWYHYESAIHPNNTSLYTFSSYAIPIEVAEKFPNKKYSEMTVTLYTYSDSTCTINVGEASRGTCIVSLPENAQTLPTAVMSLYPVSSLSAEFNGLYIQNKTKVQANFTGSYGKYNASLKAFAINVNGKDYGEPYQSDLLSKSGTIPVTGTVIDTRECSSSITQNITVLAYSKPSLIPFPGETSIICKRCDTLGNISPSGTCVRIKVGRQYSKVISGDVQKNFCLIRFKYKTEESTSWQPYTTILQEGDTADSIDKIITAINLSPSNTYLVQLEVVDTVGEGYSTLITIPTADVTVHLRDGGKAIGIGKYAEKDNIVDIDDEWELRARGNLYAGHISEIDVYDGKDFNSLSTKTGYYISSSAPETVGCKNYPVNVTGILEVVAGGGFAYQTYRIYTGEVYVRSYFVSAGWFAWRQVYLI